MKNRSCTILALAALAFVGCSKAEEFNCNPDSALQIESVGSVSQYARMQAQPASKAVIDGNELPGSEAAQGIGVFVTAQDGSAYDDHDKGYSNVKYTYNGEKWNTTTPIYLSNTVGKLYGYFPYNAGATNLKAIPVASSLNGTDYLYAEQQEVSFADRSVNLQMNHALARLHLTLKKGEKYKANGDISKITLKSTAIDASGTMDITTGEVSATKAKTDKGVVELAASGSLSTGDQTYDILLVPADASDAAKPFDILISIDGTTAGVTLSGDNGITVQSGKQYDVTLEIQDTGIKVSGVGVGVWCEGGSQTVTVGGDYTVTVKLAEVSGIEKDIWVKVYVDGASVVIKAQAESGRSIECVLSDDKLCDFTKNNNIYTFTISDITSDLTATVGYTIAHSVSLNKDALNLIKDYGHYRLVATVLPEEAEDKTLIWSSSDESVATVDQNGYVKALTTGSATITAETKVGGHTATCTVTVVEPQSRPDGTLPGHFSVSDSTVVYFSKGNLYCSGATFNDDGTVLSLVNATWGFETHQYDTTPSENGDRNLKHISHFMWCSSAEKAMALRFDTEWYRQKKPFFAEKDFPVGGVNAWSTPTMDEWRYLLNTRTMKYDVPRYTNKTSGITIGGISYFGLFIYPDDYDGMVVGDASETWTWENINDAGIVFLPAAGCRDRFSNSNVYDVGNHGYYWSSTPYANGSACNLRFLSGYVYPSYDSAWSYAYAVRLVTESK